MKGLFRLGSIWHAFLAGVSWEALVLGPASLAHSALYAACSSSDAHKTFIKQARRCSLICRIEAFAMYPFICQLLHRISELVGSSEPLHAGL